MLHAKTAVHAKKSGTNFSYCAAGHSVLSWQGGSSSVMSCRPYCGSGLSGGPDCTTSPSCLRPAHNCCYKTSSTAKAIVLPTASKVIPGLHSNTPASQACQPIMRSPVVCMLLHICTCTCIVYTTHDMHAVAPIGLSSHALLSRYVVVESPVCLDVCGRICVCGGMLLYCLGSKSCSSLVWHRR